MKRRDFLRSATAAASLPILPALPAGATAAAPLSSAQVGWAALFARVNERASPALIQKWMKVGPAQSSALMAELVNRNILHAPVAGSAAAVQPMYPTTGIPGVAKTTSQIIEKARDVMDAILPEEDDMQIAPSPEQARQPEPRDETS